MRRVLQIIVIVAIVATAVLCVIEVLKRTPFKYERETRVLISCAAVALAGAAALSAYVLGATGRYRPLAWITGATSVIALVYVLATTWSDRVHSDTVKVTIAFSTVALGGAYACALLRPHLLARYEWSRWATLIALVSLVGLILYSLSGARDVRADRWLAIASVLTAAGTIITRVLLGASRRARGVLDPGELPGLTRCPNCGHALRGDISDVF